MPRRLIIIGPKPPDHGPGWCAVCVAEWKMTLVKDLGIDAEWIKRELAGKPDDKPRIIAPKPGARMPPLDIGITYAPVAKLGGTCLVCWTHADALSDSPGPPPVPPGLGGQQLIPGLS